MPDRILIADDEPSVREALAMALEREGYAVTAAAGGREAWALLSGASPPDLAVLDIVMGDLEGTAVLGRLRAAGSSLPVILLTSRDEELDRLSGFALGADDYIGKPFSVREVCARVAAVLRRCRSRAADGAGAAPEHAAAAAVSCGAAGALRVDAASCRAWFAREELCLTITEFRILEAFCAHRGAALSREQLLTHAYPDDGWISERSVDSHVKRLRRKLSEAGADDDLIQTVYGLGYRMKERA